MSKNKNTTRKDNFKDFDSQIAAINFVASLKNAPFEVIEVPGLKGQFTKSEKKSSLHFTESNVAARLSQIKFASIDIQDTVLLVGPLSFESTAANININTGIHFNQSYTIHTIKTKNFDKEPPCRFRCFFPVSLENLRSFHRVFQAVTYQDSKGTDHFYDCIRFTISNKVFDATQVKTEQNAYYIIESLADIEFDEFRMYCFSIQQAIGFISGYMPGGEEYIFSTPTDFYYTNHIRPAINALYQPINSNPFNYDEIDKETAQKYYEHLNGLPEHVFSELTSKIFNSPKLSSTIILLLESSSVRSFLLIPSVFSVVIESLSKIISVPETGIIMPIPDKKLEVEILAELRRVLENHKTVLNPSAHSKLLNRLKGINRPINKVHLTNDEKLMQPFEQLGIDLSVQDLQAIEHRNALLHGDLLLNDPIEKSQKEMDGYMAYISGKLYTLISKLILKYVGYSGFVTNHAKFYEKYSGSVSIEDYYHEI